MFKIDLTSNRRQPLPKPVMTKLHVTVWRDWFSISFEFHDAINNLISKVCDENRPWLYLYHA